MCASDRGAAASRQRTGRQSNAAHWFCTSCVNSCPEESRREDVEAELSASVVRAARRREVLLLRPGEQGLRLRQLHQRRCGVGLRRGMAPAPASVRTRTPDASPKSRFGEGRSRHVRVDLCFESRHPPRGAQWRHMSNMSTKCFSASFTARRMFYPPHRAHVFFLCILLLNLSQHRLRKPRNVELVRLI